MSGRSLVGQTVGQMTAQTHKPKTKEISLMVTTQEFKTAHSLSDSSFKRLVAKVKTDRPDIEQMTARTGNEWEILHPELLEAELEKRSRKSEVVEAEIVDPFAIQPYTPRVSALSNAFSSLKPLEVHPTFELNDQSDDIKNQLVSMLGFLNSQAQNSDALIQTELEQARQLGQMKALAKFQAQKQAETETLLQLQQLDAMNSGLVKKPQEETLQSIS